MRNLFIISTFFVFCSSNVLIGQQKIDSLLNDKKNITLDSFKNSTCKIIDFDDDDVEFIRKSIQEGNSLVDYQCVSQKMKDFFYYYHNLETWIKEDKSVPEEYELIIYRECEEEDCTSVEILTRLGDATSIVIKEYYRDKRANQIQIGRLYQLREKGRFQSPELGFQIGGKKKGKPYGFKNAAISKELCESFRKRNDDEFFQNAFNEGRAFCNIRDFYYAFP